MMNQSAQGLASLGRGNDSMLVHMTPREVEGLQGLAMAHGGSLTINPQTGLPEAGFLDAVLPMAAGFALGPGGFGLFSGANAALMAGLTVGGLTALTSGDLGKGLMAGFGAYGGAGLGDAIKSFGANAGKAGDLNSKIYDKAQKDFASSFPSGSEQTVFNDNPGFFQFVKNIYLKNAEDYIKNGTMPTVPSSDTLLKMFNNQLTTKPAASVKPASKLSGKDSPLASTRPKNIQSILDKYPKTGSRSTNTQEELDVPWDLAGQGLED
jgi:hypothetical protein